MANRYIAGHQDGRIGLEQTRERENVYRTYKVVRFLYRASTLSFLDCQVPVISLDVCVS
jgi:hypothetical protein